MTDSNCTEVCQEQEIWKDIPGYEGKYQASNLGRIKSLARFVNGRWGNCCKPIKETILRPIASSNHERDVCYWYVNLWNGLSRRSKFTAIHRLILTTFVGPCPEGMEACHFPDRNTANNRLDNLRWDTREANDDDKIKHGTTPKGEKNGNTDLTNEQVIELRRKHSEGVLRSELAKEYGIGWSTVDRIVKRVVWKHV